MLDEILAFSRENGLFEPGECVTVALSGGADSMALLCALQELQTQLGITLRAAHFNHGLRGEAAQRDETFVTEQCRLRGVPLTCGSGDVRVFASQHGMSLEQAARTLRYDFLQSASAGGKLATAHNADDNAETLLLHLLRGSGLRGLCGIAPKRGALVRPLLCVTREQIEDYLRTREIAHVEDETNADDSCTRNRLRHHVMPLLLAENPSFLRTASRTAQLLRQDEALLCAVTAQAKQECETTGGYSCEKLRALPDAVRSKLLVELLWERGLENPSAASTHALEQLLRASCPSARVSLQGGWSAARCYDTLTLKRDVTRATFAETQLKIPGSTPLPGIGMKLTCSVIKYSKKSQRYSNTLLLRYDILSEASWYARPRKTADTLRLPGGSKSVKRLMIDRKIPAAQRESLPLLVCGTRIAAVCGVGVDSAFRPQEGDTVLAICLEGEKEK